MRKIILSLLFAGIPILSLCAVEVSFKMTRMTMGWAGANAVSGVLSEASCSRSGAQHYKKRG